MIFAWNLKAGQTAAFSYIIIFSLLDLFFIGLVFQILSGKEIAFWKKNKKQMDPELEKEPSSEINIQREYVDTKTQAERIFKSVMLKRSVKSFGEKILENLADEFEGFQGIFYVYKKADKKFHPISFYAMIDNEQVKAFAAGEGLNGQAVNEENITILSNLPKSYRPVKSGLGEANPQFLYFIPFFNDNSCIALVELSTFKEVTESKINTLNYLVLLGGKKLTQFREKINE